MSIHAMNIVWRHYPEGGGELLLVLALADWANDEGQSIHPSVAAAAKKARISERQTQRLLRTIVQRGYLVAAGETEYGTRRYCLRLDLLQQLPLICGRPRDRRVTPGDTMSPGDGGDKKAATDVSLRVTLAPETAREMSPKPFTTSLHPSTTTDVGVETEFCWPSEITPALREQIKPILAECPGDKRYAVLNEWVYQIQKKDIKDPLGYLAGIVRRAVSGRFTSTVNFQQSRRTHAEQAAAERRASAEQEMDKRRERLLAKRRSGGK